MRTFALACLLLALSACKKFDGNSITLPQGNKPVWIPVPDTIPDHSSITLRLMLDSTDYDETEFVFDHRASINFDQNNDAGYFPGFGKVSLASLSGNGRDMAIYDLPYKPGMPVRLDVHSKRDGTLSLGISRLKNIPPDIRIWVKDHYASDSLDLCKGAYSFRVNRADTSSMGCGRLKLVLVSRHAH